MTEIVENALAAPAATVQIALARRENA